MAIGLVPPASALWSGVVGIAYRVRVFLIPMWEFLFATSVGLLFSGVVLGAAIPWRAGGAIVKLFVGIFAFIVGTYVVLVLSTFFREPSRR